MPNVPRGFIELHTVDGRSLFLCVAHVTAFGPSSTSNYKAWIQIGDNDDSCWQVKETIEEIAVAINAACKVAVAE